MERTIQFSTVQPADSRPFRGLAGDRHRRWYVLLTPFEPTLAAHNEGKSLMRIHPNYSKLKGTAGAIRAGDNSRRPGETPYSTGG